jgi:hypothetical protein
MLYYVYLYRDKCGKPQYVGYGKRAGRATIHWTKSHNPTLSSFLKKKKFTLEIAGPFKSEPVGRTVETSLISALDPKFNYVKGPHSARFRPIGVPDKYAKRPSKTPLLRKDFINCQGSPATSVLFVSVSGEKFGDGRVGYDLAKPPTDEQVLDRVREWWQLSRLITKWVKTPGKSPGLLVGIHGPPGSQLVIASTKIDRRAWKKSKRRKGGLHRVPLFETPQPNLDAFNLRGRRLDPKARLAFDSIRSGQFIWMRRNSSLIGGRRPR